MKNFLNNIKGFFDSVKSHPHAEIKDTNKIEIFDNTIFFVCSVASAFINLILYYQKRTREKLSSLYNFIRSSLIQSGGGT